MLRNAILFTVALAAFSATGAAAPPGSHLAPGPAKQRPGLTTAVQPRLSGLMNDYGNRFVDAYFAAEGQNWALAQYQLREMRAIGKTAALIRPDSAALLKAFSKRYMASVEDAVVAKDWSKFSDSYRAAAEGCNNCHVSMKRGFIRFERPPRPAEDYIDFMHPSEPLADQGQ